MQVGVEGSDFLGDCGVVQVTSTRVRKNVK